MALLDIQAMEPTTTENHGGGSNVSLTLCASSASATVCL